MSMTVISADEINQLQAMFPQTDSATIKRTLLKEGSVEAAVMKLLALDQSKTPEPPKKPETKVEEDEDKPWACPACTLQNQAGTFKCAVCSTTSPIKPKFTIPSWWASFWEEYKSHTPYSEEEAQVIVLKGGDFKNSRTLTLEVKKRALKKLDISEIHSGPTDGGGTPFPFGTPAYPYPTPIIHPLHPYPGPYYPTPSSGFRHHPPAMG